MSLDRKHQNPICDIGDEKNSSDICPTLSNIFSPRLSFTHWLQIPNTHVYLAHQPGYSEPLQPKRSVATPFHRHLQHSPVYHCRSQILYYGGPCTACLHPGSRECNWNDVFRSRTAVYKCCCQVRCSRDSAIQRRFCRCSRPPPAAPCPDRDETHFLSRPQHHLYNYFF